MLRISRSIFYKKILVFDWYVFLDFSWSFKLNNIKSFKLSRSFILETVDNDIYPNIFYIKFTIERVKFKKRNWALATNSNFQIYIYATWWCKPLIFQTYIIWSNRIDILKYLRFLGYKDISLRKSDFVATTKFLLIILSITSKMFILKPFNSYGRPWNLIFIQSCIQIKFRQIRHIS